MNTLKQRMLSRRFASVPLVVAVLFMAIIGTELVTFDKFVRIMTQYPLFSHEIVAKIYASLIVICGVAALPFLLKQQLRAFYIKLSSLAGVLFLVLWIVLLDVAAFKKFYAEVSGLFGSLVHISVGLSLVVLSLLTLLFFWAYLIRTRQPSHK